MIVAAIATIGLIHRNDRVIYPVPVLLTFCVTDSTSYPQSPRELLLVLFVTIAGARAS